MPGFIIGGKAVQPPGIQVINWRDDPRLRLTISQTPGKRDGMPRSANTWIRAITLHTTKGIPGGSDPRPQKILPGLGPNVDNEARIARFWSGSEKQAGAHIIIDHDGGVACCADLRLEATFHCPGINIFSIGIEIFQGSQAEMYVRQLETVVSVVDFLTAEFGIQRQMPDRYRGHPCDRLVHGGDDFVGVYGHRDADNNRGEGDPGNTIFDMLSAAGYERWNIDREEDKATWKSRQAALHLTGDGVPGPRTVIALKAAGRPHGMLVPRPSDGVAALPAMVL